ncbi:MAG: GNAT family N-acetyltransferase [Candidatus Heimdallarchaeota archaeon]|nr:MAG: GNAT family N-acetyltransferase [Candidatus Heimdallarchaeota archaeon]
MIGIKIERAEKGDAEQLASISKRAFDSDAEVGGNGPGGPPGYDSPSFQLRFMRFMDYYKILLNENIVGGIFVSSGGKKHRVLERIFIDPPHHNKGIASQAMELLWEMYPQVQLWTLGTPEWNVRTRHFYEKLGFIQVGWEKGGPNWRGIWYQKVMDSSSPYEMVKVGELKDGMKDITVEGIILTISSPKKVISRSTGKNLSVVNAELGDTTGKIVLVLWNEQISQVKVDDRVRIESGYVNSYRGVYQLNIGWMGRLITLL